MKSLFALVSFFLLLSLLSTINGRKDVGEYWNQVMKDRNVEQSPDASIYRNDVSFDDRKMFANNDRLKTSPYDATIYHNDIGLKGEQIFAKNDHLKTSPYDATIYHNDKVVGMKGSVQLPDVSIYHD
ncbi:organ-specific protein S2-like [Mercurialis annua]|uniref:organ-specific protein S2-like n=1 Tax=Mercurialis annua TaxID=3986 RepID=UPI00215EA538|nr:organ-specific protein S2-like [Mercurialis annua]